MQLLGQNDGAGIIVMSGRGGQTADLAEESRSRLCFPTASAITPPFRRPAERAAVAMVKCSISTLK
jgi:hypothetical protein